MKLTRTAIYWSSGLTIPVLLAAGTLMNQNFWSTPTQRGDKLMASHHYQDAAKIYQDPLQIGIAQYRSGDYELAAKTFARVPGATGAFNAGDAWFMHGQYDTAISLYDKALGFSPGWQAALDNRQIAIARRNSLKDKGKDRQESADAYEPDSVVADRKGPSTPPDTTTPDEASGDAELQATWLRRVKTTPGDFLKAKFAWQAHNPSQTPAP